MTSTSERINREFGAVLVETAVRYLPRITALQAWQPRGSAHGCFDREFWSYRMSRGFASATWQQASLGLAHLASITPSVGDTRGLQLRAQAGFEFWMRSRHADGSVAEWYRHEHSYCATAHGLHGLSEAIGLGLFRDQPERETGLLRDLRITAAWLAARWNNLAGNQNVAAVAGRTLLSSLQGGDDDPSLARATDRLVREFRSHGFFPEYGGMDFGYSLLCVDLLATAARCGSTTCGEIAAEVVGHLRRFSSSTGRLPWLLGSRMTAHAPVAGLLYLTPYSGDAAWFVERMSEQRECVDEWMGSYDDRYLSYFGFPTLARAAAWSRRGSSPVSHPSQNLGLGSTQPIGLDTFLIDSRRVVHAVGHGGGLAFESPNGAFEYDLGYEVHHGSTRYSSRSITTRLPARLVASSDLRPLQRFGILAQLALASAALRPLSALISRLARTRIGRPRRTIAVTFERRVVALGASVLVEDRLVSKVIDLRSHVSPATSGVVHSPSAMLDQQSPVGAVDGIDDHNFSPDGRTMSRTYRFPYGEVVTPRTAV